MSYRSMQIATALQKIAEKDLLLPAIQRRFVWPVERIYSYLDSLLRDYPTGVLLFWNTKQRVQYRDFLQSSEDDLTYHNKSEGEHGTLVLDGQQRLQSLYLALAGTVEQQILYFDVLGSGLDGEHAGEARYHFRFMQDREAATANDEERALWVPLREILQCKNIQQRIQLVHRYQKKASVAQDSEAGAQIDVNVQTVESKLKMEKALTYYEIDPEYGQSGPVTPIEEILEIFVRINSGGQVLSKSDLMFSLLQLRWEGAAQTIDALTARLNSAGRFDFGKDFILRSALVCIGKGARYDVNKLRSASTIELIENQFPRVARALDNLIDFLKKDARVRDQRILQSYNSLIPFVYFLYHQPQQRLQGEGMRRDMNVAFYLALMTSVFARYAESRIDGVIREVFVPARKRGENDFPLREFRAFVRRREGRERFDNWLLQNNISRVVNILERGADMEAGRRHRPEYDHIFPKSKLQQHGYPKEQIDNFANLRLISKEDNIWKRDIDPRLYFEENPGVAERYLIPTEHLDYDQYEQFLLMRRKRIWDEIKAFLGLGEDEYIGDERLTPGEEDAAINQLEEHLRDFIDASLADAFDKQYWKQHIPGDVQAKVKQRIHSHLNKHPGKSWGDYVSARSRLDFCDVSDYERVILSKLNWPVFDNTFRNKDEFKRHMTALVSFRNSVKHGREVSTVQQLTGEAALIWFRDALGIEDSGLQAGLDAQTEGTNGNVEAEEPTVEDCLQVLTRMDVPYGQQQIYRSLFTEDGSAVRYEDAVKLAAEGSKSRWRGIMGALGTRVNYTDGYGKQHKPGTNMIVQWSKSDGEWFIQLRSVMRQALEQLDPDWLK